MSQEKMYRDTDKNLYQIPELKQIEYISTWYGPSDDGTWDVHITSSHGYYYSANEIHIFYNVENRNVNVRLFNDYRFPLLLIYSEPISSGLSSARTLVWNCYVSEANTQRVSVSVPSEGFFVYIPITQPTA